MKELKDNKKINTTIATIMRYYFVSNYEFCREKDFFKKVKKHIKNSQDAKKIYL